MSVRSISISISAIARISIHVPSRLLNSRRPPIALISISIPHVKKERKYNKKRNLPRKAFFLPNIYHHYKSINTNRILTPKPPPFPFFETFSPIFPIFPFIGINLVGTHFSLHRSGLFIEESSDNKKKRQRADKDLCNGLCLICFSNCQFFCEDLLGHCQRECKSASIV